MSTKTQKKSAYIGGKVSGLDFNQVVEKFKAKADELRSLGYEVTNPVERIIMLNHSRLRLDEVPLNDMDHRKEIMGICILDLSRCDELHLLEDYRESIGAMLEWDFAESTGMKIIYH